MSRTIKIDQLAEAVNEELEEYSKLTAVSMKAATAQQYYDVINKLKSILVILIKIIIIFINCNWSKDSIDFFNK